MDAEKGKILAVDFGDNNVGLAICDASRTHIAGRGVLRDFGSLEQLGGTLAGILKEEGQGGVSAIGSVLFGLPYGANGEENEQTRRYRSIGDRLRVFVEKELGGAVEWMYTDESFSSFEARERMRLMGDKKLAGRFSEHEQAAMMLLERYLYL